MAKLGERGCALQFPSESRGVGLHPALLVHRGGALLENVDRARQAAGLVGGVCERNFPGVIPVGDGLHGTFQGPDGFDDAAKRQEAQQPRQQERRRVRDQHSPPELVDAENHFITGGLGGCFDLSHPFAQALAQAIADAAEQVALPGQRLLFPTLVRKGHHLFGAGAIVPA